MGGAWQATSGSGWSYGSSFWGTEIDRYYDTHEPRRLSKVVKECTLPLTAVNAVTVLVTELAKFRFIDGRLTLVEIMPGVTLKEVEEKTEANFVVQL